MLDAQSTSTTGPVTSRLSASGAVSNDTPRRGRLPASTVDVHDAVATPAFVIPLAGYETDPPLRGASVASAPSISPRFARGSGRR